MTTLIRQGWWLLAALISLQVDSAELTRAEIEFIGNAYKYEFQVNIDAPLEATRRVVTDYDNIKQINDGVIDSSVLEVYDENWLKRRLWLEHCILVFCFDLLFIENVRQNGPNEIVTTVIPEESNFKRGEAMWRLTALSDNRTQISVIAEQEPDFWIPPLVGKALMRRAFKKETEETTNNIEQAALKVAEEIAKERTGGITPKTVPNAPPASVVAP